ncbi:prepilin-type N-terminal cleavage/methylation domain-containing protein [Pseudothermotoga sp.]|nr:prepilin-type N-terminal cleavage/methylation domain-containing protein [Pseudothermotoga sp.]MCX7812170.1 prepilin-type N-terminal cleavage/methylation domain-containing protein [Pseudothermotoga sp.]MDW8139240.1 prepilin-type N-terminal cleavage/methylation domain-containing protein [Pseudothermotoga sp.]
MKSAYTLLEIIMALAIIAIAAIVLFSILSNVLSGMGRVYRESVKNFEANSKLESYLTGATSEAVPSEISYLRVTELATQLQVQIIRPSGSEYRNIPLFLFEPTQAQQ